VIVAIVVFELAICFLATVLIAVGSTNDQQAVLPLRAWLICAILQLAIHYLPRSRYARYALSFVVAAIVCAGLTWNGAAALTSLHQPLFIAGIATVPQLWWERFHGDTQERNSVLALIAITALPLGIIVWSFANIWIVKVEAWRVSQGEPYCVFISNGRLFSSGYHRAPDDWSLSGWRMFSGRGGGGSGNCCQWDFHALLQTSDKRLLNWSYRSQQFELISEKTRRSLRLGNLECQPAS
jgi:hypothetical protein